MKVLLQDVIDAIEQTTNELHFFTTCLKKSSYAILNLIKEY